MWNRAAATLCLLVAACRAQPTEPQFPAAHRDVAPTASDTFSTEDARDRLAEVSGDRKFATEFFEKYIEGRELPNYEKLFARVGLILRKRNPGAPWVGLMDQSFGGGGSRLGKRCRSRER